MCWSQSSVGGCCSSLKPSKVSISSLSNCVSASAGGAVVVVVVGGRVVGGRVLGERVLDGGTNELVGVCVNCWKDNAACCCC